MAFTPEQIVVSSLEEANKIRMHHWLSINKNQHEILGDLYGTLDGLIDSLVENVVGKNLVDTGVATIQVAMPGGGRYMVSESESALEAGKRTFGAIKIQYVGTAHPILTLLDDILLAYDKAIYLMNMVK